MRRKPLHEVRDANLRRAITARARENDPSLHYESLVVQRGNSRQVIGFPPVDCGPGAPATAAQWARALRLRPSGGKHAADVTYRGIIDGCEVVIYSSFEGIRLGKGKTAAGWLRAPRPESRNNFPVVVARRASLLDETHIIPMIQTPTGKHAAADSLRPSTGTRRPLDGCFRGDLLA
ncbi:MULTISPECIES: hypothetical protein [Actinomycetes]|uniref:hypothetical protein n=1 Tax=Actinomycetes TaxID=1760 RepID=UPI0001DEE7E6|nr:MULTISPECIES: hypothetical protein [Actinomycetes]EFL09460.1 predicted protein [Streptomyces sp. AA4]